jgi:hypothetical protein
MSAWQAVRARLSEEESALPSAAASAWSSATNAPLTPITVAETALATAARQPTPSFGSSGWGCRRWLTRVSGFL